MTILGVPDGSGFTIGTSSNIAPASGGATNVDMSLDDMIKNRRREQRKSPKPTSSDRNAGRIRAGRQAKLDARRGLRADDRASSMEIEKEVHREASKSPANRGPKDSSNNNNNNNTNDNRRARRSAEVKTKAKNEKEQKKKKEDDSESNALPPAWIGGTRRPPSKKAISAAVNAMTDAGFRIPKGMQMVISFAPAPTEDPTKMLAEQNKNNGGKRKPRGGGNNRNEQRNNNNNNNNNRGNNNRGRGGR